MAPEGPAGVVVLGAGGRLGSRVVALLKGAADARLLAARERPGSSLVGQPVPDHDGLLYTEDTAALPAGTRVVLDISAASAVSAHVAQCVEARVALLVAVTGLSADSERTLESASAVIPVCVAPNLGTGVWVLAYLLKQAARILPDFDVELVETHHRAKKDAPSGTALMLARHVAEGRGVPLESIRVDDRTDHPDVRRLGSLGITAVRGGDVVGDHVVHLLGDGERLELTHRATSRDVFARGAVRLAPRLAAARAGRHSVPQLLSLE